MKSDKHKKKASPALQSRLTNLEEEAVKRSFGVHYDLLEAAGLKLKSGVCRIRGEVHIFIDRRKSVAEKVEYLQDFLDHPLPHNIPEIHD